MLVEKDMGSPIKVLCTDRGGEYISQEFAKFCENRRIRRQLTATYMFNKTEFVNGKIAQFLTGIY